MISEPPPRADGRPAGRPAGQAVGESTIDRPDVAVGASHRQRVRTFKPRRRALSPARQQRLERIADRWLIEESDADRGWKETFGRAADVVLDIGIGDGESCVDLARRYPDLDIVGADVHTPGIAHAAFCADDDALANLRLYHGDVFELIERIPLRSLAGIRVLFPDPWPKVRHRNRRMITPARVDILASRLANGGVLHLATDIDDYAQQMLDVCGQHGELVGGSIERPSRPITRFEQRGLDVGRTITELAFRRVIGGGDADQVSDAPWANWLSRSTASMNSDTIS